MTMRNTTKTIGGILLALELLLSLSVTAFAYARIDTDEETSLTLNCMSGSTALSGVDFRIYKVADVSDAGYYTVIEPFTKYIDKVTYLKDLNSIPSTEAWADLAATLAGCAAQDSLPPLMKDKTDTSSALTFSGLYTGLYLVTGDPVKIGNYTYTPTPFLISLPSLNDKDAWEYNVTADVKFGEDYEGGGTSTTQRSVVKVWNDDGGENRPESVTVQLLKNGTVYSEVMLSKENNWRYTWTDLSSGSTWQLVEKEVPDGYTVSVSRNGLIFTVTNTETPDEPDHPDQPDNPDNPDNPDEPDNPDQPDNPDNPDNPDQPDIPQTGQLWWPVPLLAGGGLTLFAAGWALVFLKRKNDA